MATNNTSGLFINKDYLKNYKPNGWKKSLDEHSKKRREEAIAQGKKVTQIMTTEMYDQMMKEDASHKRKSGKKTCGACGEVGHLQTNRKCRARKTR